jgi:cysteine synthase A
MKRLSDNVGNTPLLEIHTGDQYFVYAKAEFMNPSGSVKDRMATYIINDAEEKGLIKPGDTLCEATSGNTGIALSMLAAERGYKMEIVMPGNMSIERKQMFKSYDANLREVPDGDFDHAIMTRDVMSKHHKWFNCNQFHNPLNIKAHYETTGPEIYKEYMEKGLEPPKAFIAGTGTGGTLMGTGKYLKEKWPDMKIIAVEPAESPVMSGGEPGLHGIQGIGDGSKFLVDMDFVDEVVTVKTTDAKRKAKNLALEGIFVGISSGANVLAAERWQWENEGDCNVVTILSDRGERYFSCM